MDNNTPKQHNATPPSTPHNQHAPNPASKKLQHGGLLLFAFVVLCLAGYLALTYEKSGEDDNAVPIVRSNSTASPVTTVEDDNAVPVVRSNSTASPITTAEDDFYTAVQNVFQDATGRYAGETATNSQQSVWWISDDGFSIIDDNAPGVAFYAFNCEADDTNATFRTIAQDIGTAVDAVLSQNGFTFIQDKSSTSMDDEQFHDYVRAYENGGTRAVYTASPDCWTISSEPPGDAHYSFKFAFTDAFDANYQEQIPYLRDLNIHDAVIHVERTSGDFILLAVNYRRTGYEIVAQRVDGVWTARFSGQDYPSCSIKQQYNIPDDIIPTCFPE